MPVRLLTEAERERLSAFPKEVPTEDLFSFFALTGPDRAAIPARSAPSNRLGFALALCAVRYLGFCPEDLASVPEDVAWYVGQQLMVAPEALAGYPEREQTRTDHLNLHERPHEKARLGRHGLREVHLPVKDFAAPSPCQVERGVGAILGALMTGEAAAVHCGGGLGRTGTLLACYLLLVSSEGLGAGEAIRRVRSLRPGSVETPAQAAAVDAWARGPGSTQGAPPMRKVAEPRKPSGGSAARASWKPVRLRS